MMKPAQVDKSRQYPIRCRRCGEKEVRPAVVRHRLKKNYDGRLYDLAIADLPVAKCGACGAVSFTQESDDRISRALRDKLGLLHPQQIRTNIDALGFRQKELAERIGVAPETLSRWLSGSMIQTRAMDNLLRAFFGCREVRDRLTGEGQDPAFGAEVNVTVRQG